MIRKYITNWVRRHIPELVTFQPLQDRTLVAIYGVYPHPTIAMSDAVERILAQMPLQTDDQPHEYLLYHADQQALAAMCNAYCMHLAETYQRYVPESHYSVV
ncbi:MAG: hypothetical protein Q8K92_19805 [Leadbetterella sp.]|nr:hypothetical protein [Leadbetterella sp.]